MTLRIRKTIVLFLVGTLVVLANLWVVVAWLDERGIIDWARQVRREYLTGTAITIVGALLILLVGPGAERSRFLRRCPVCDRVLLGSAKYCGECGSKV